MELCTLFGDYFTPDHIRFPLEKAILSQYRQYNIKHFICSNRGYFDSLVCQAFSYVKSSCPELRLILLQPPQESKADDISFQDFDGIYRPVVKNENIAELTLYREYQNLLDVSDCTICHSIGYGAVGSLFEYALEREAHSLLRVCNLAGLPLTIH